MSRVGRKPIPLPKGVTVKIGEELQVEGPKGKLRVPVPAGITAKQRAAAFMRIRRRAVRSNFFREMSADPEFCRVRHN